MKGIFNKTLVIALLMSVPYANAGVVDVVKGFAGNAGRFVGQHSAEFWGFIKKHPYAFGVPAAVILCEAGVRGYNKLMGKKDNGVNTPSRWMKNNPKTAAAVLFGAAALIVDANTTGYAARAASKIVAGGKIGYDEAVTFVADNAAQHPTATKVAEVVAGTAAAAVLVYGGVKVVKAYKANSVKPAAQPTVVKLAKTSCEEAASVKSVSSLQGYIATVKSIFNAQHEVIKRVQLDSQATLDACKGLLSSEDLATLKTQIVLFNKNVTMIPLVARSADAIVALLEKAQASK